MEKNINQYAASSFHVGELKSGGVHHKHDVRTTPPKKAGLLKQAEDGSSGPKLGHVHSLKPEQKER